MKVKLLKKVRKRYQILKVTQVAPSDCLWGDSYNRWKLKYGLPFFVLRDNHDSDCETARDNKDELLAILASWIKSDYTSKVKPKIKTIEEVVWYPKQKK